MRLVTAALAEISLVLSGCAQLEPLTADLAIVDVTVIDVESGQAVPDQTVLIEDGGISAVVDIGSFEVVAVRSINGEGRFLMPGLIDMHVHINVPGLTAFPSYGVTTVRDMGTQFAPIDPERSILGARNRKRRDELYAPEIFTGVVILDGPVDRNPRSSVDAALGWFEAHQRNVLQLHQAGVPVLVGTDAVNPFVVPGESIHAELELLVDAGLTNAEVLRAVTVNNARYLRADDRIGRVEAGFEADLVLLSRNPLDDIAATRTIEAVILDGEFLDAGELKRRHLESVD